MSKNLILFIFASLLNVANVAFAEVGGLNCIQIEGLNLGCVSSVDHSCKMNRAADSKVDCAYGGGWASRYRVEGPIQFNCKSYKNTTTTENVPARGCCPGMACVPGDTCSPARTVTTTHSECLQYEDPVCAESCVGCFENVQTFPVGISRGCIVCTRQSCGDEPPAQISCPDVPGLTLLGSAKKCSGDERCPTTAVDPLGQSHGVRINTSCNAGPAPSPSAPGAIGKYCPWKSDQRTGGSATADEGIPASSGKCECITEDNWNPNAGPWPGCPTAVGP